MAVGGIGLFLISVGLLEWLLVRQPEEPTHPLVSPVLKIFCGTLGKFAFFAAFYPFLLIQIIYGVWAWLTQESRWRRRRHRRTTGKLWRLPSRPW